jgi:hypothetical protein
MLINTDPNSSYGILLSGGLDSAILLYLLVSVNPDIKIQPFTIAKSDGAALYADPVIEHFNNKFKLKIPNTIIVGDPTVHHRQQSTTAVKEIFVSYPVDFLFIGINTNPPELNSLPGAPSRDTKSNDPRIIFPFVDMYKDQILALMYQNQQEDLVNITHSCTEQRYNRCNQCWQCTERAWAFTQLNKEDTGIL